VALDPGACITGNHHQPHRDFFLESPFTLDQGGEIAPRVRQECGDLGPLHRVGKVSRIAVDLRRWYPLKHHDLLSRGNSQWPNRRQSRFLARGWSRTTQGDLECQGMFIVERLGQFGRDSLSFSPGFQRPVEGTVFVGALAMPDIKDFPV
jgi:hypothetical protein